MQLLRLSIYFLGLLAALMISAFLFAVVSNAQTLEPKLKPDMRRALGARPDKFTRAGRVGGYVPSRAQRSDEIRPRHLGRRINLTLSIHAPGSRIFINKLRLH